MINSWNFSTDILIAALSSLKNCRRCSASAFWKRIGLLRERRLERECKHRCDFFHPRRSRLEGDLTVSSLLLSVDLEDVRAWVKDGTRYRDGVVENTRTYLQHFKRWGVKATFFVVGEVARRYPSLMRGNCRGRARAGLPWRCPSAAR